MVSDEKKKKKMPQDHMNSYDYSKSFFENENVVFEFIESKTLSDLTNSSKYAELLLELDKINQFKEDFSNDSGIS